MDVAHVEVPFVFRRIDWKKMMLLQISMVVPEGVVVAAVVAVPGAEEGV